MKRLSIISTLYRTAAYLPKCMESLLTQDVPAEEYEIILVNDGSPENDLEIAESYASQHPNVKVISQQNKGLAGARNTGLSAASGVYVCFVDPDDYIEPNSLAALLTQMDEEQLDMLRFDYHVVNEAYREIPKTRDAQLIDYSSGVMDGKAFLTKRLGYACYVWTYIFRRSVLADNGIAFREGDYFDDTFWLPQVCCAARRVNSTSVKHYYYLQRGNSLVNTVSIDATKRKLNAQMVMISRLQNQRQHMGADVQSWYTGMNSKTALSILTTAAIACPGDCGKYLSALKKYRVFPLRLLAGSKAQKIKCMALNVCPRLFCKLLNWKNKK